MNLRFLKKVDGTKILQMNIAYGTSMAEDWEDIPMIKEPRPARDFWIHKQSPDGEYNHACVVDLRINGKTPACFSIGCEPIHVREVLE